MGAEETATSEKRVLVVAPTKRDGEVTRSLLAEAGLSCVVCQDLHKLCREIEIGSGAVLLTEEAVSAPGIDQLLEVLDTQPPWSDLAVVLLIRGGAVSPAAAHVFRSLTNVTLLERPAPIRSVVSAVQTAVRGRVRQYQIRDQLESIRRADATSSELRRQLEIAVDASELGTFHCKVPLGHIIWNERCKQHFWLPPEAEVDIDLFYSILHPDDRERTRQAVEACVYNRQSYDIEFRTVSPKGSTRWIRATGRTQYNEQEQPIQFDGTTQDISARKRAEEGLEEASRRKDEFLATLAHELRNPLAPIRSSLHLLRLSGELSPSLVSVQAIMERQVDHMVRLIDDLLDVSRISRGKIELQKKSIELAPIIATAIQTSRPVIDAGRHQLATCVPNEPILLEADPVRLAQIVSNLLINAAKYTPSGGQIWLSARYQGEEVVLSVRDNGMGIPALMLPRVFEMFAQVDRTLTRAQGGLGIGLTLTKSFVEMHGGRIEVHSEGLDKGSEFMVYLPMVRESQPRFASEPIVQDHRNAASRRRILIIDDMRAAGHVLGQLLKTIGQQVTVVEDGASAIRSVRKELPDLVISDIAMPHMDGYELARVLRRQPGFENVVLVALTGFGQESDKQRAKEAGFDHHLVKPVSLEALQDLLAGLPPITDGNNTPPSDLTSS